ncbi:hypothetical protein [Alkalibacillus haloalkaliphilus]|uniref:hypothetical protein n=1 Tax=Alkalibacillus haloalkaliphilus TaxID=94136 RepID=UPI0002F4C464|nr:hypothetical protein [Alkalibacillus haloalkaliphilus]
MYPPESILSVWRKFDNFPLEVLTKVWYDQQSLDEKQRSVELMKEHRQQYGTSGNCFDLSIWLLQEFKENGLYAYPVGHDWYTEKAHVAVVVLDEWGRRYLCDLGDQWILPILLDEESEDFTNESLTGFFPAARVEVRPKPEEVTIVYHRPGGKLSSQTYQLEPLTESELWIMAEFSQQNINPRPLIESRVHTPSEVQHWEFNNWESFLSTNDGLFYDPKLEKIDLLAERISLRTGIVQKFVIETLEMYATLSQKIR